MSPEAIASRIPVKESSPVSPNKKRHAIKHQARRQHSDDEELQRRLVGAQVALAPSGQQEQRPGGELQGHEQDHQVPRRGQHHRTQQRRQEQQVVLPLVEAVRLDVGDREQEHQVAGHQEHSLQHQREVVHHVGPVEHRIGVAGDRHQDHRHHGQGGSHQRQGGHVVLAFPGQEEIDGQHHQECCGHHQLGGDGQPVDPRHHLASDSPVGRLHQTHHRVGGGSQHQPGIHADRHDQHDQRRPGSHLVAVDVLEGLALPLR